MTPRRFANLLLVGLFLLGVGSYGGASLWNALADRTKLAEVRVLAWKFIPGWAEGYFTVHLAARDAIVTWHGRIKADWLRTSPNPKVWLGRDGWLFYNHTAEAGFIPPSDPAMPARLDRWATALSARRTWLEDRGIKYLVVATANKQSVYPEYLPRPARLGGPTPLDQLLDRCGRDSELRLLDLRPVLRAARPTGRLFWQTDTHWSPVGDYAGYAATVEALQRWYPSLVPLPWSAFDLRPTMFPGGDLARLMGLDRRRTEDVPRLAWCVKKHARPVAEKIAFQADPKLAHVPTDVWLNDTPGLPRVVLLGDSFADDEYCTLLAEHCSRLVRVGSYDGQEAMIERERPDVVICQFIERMLEGGYVPRPPVKASDDFERSEELFGRLVEERRPLGRCHHDKKH